MTNPEAIIADLTERLRVAREALEKALPHVVGNRRRAGGAGESDDWAEDEALVRAALSTLAEPVSQPTP